MAIEQVVMIDSQPLCPDLGPAMEAMMRFQIRTSLPSSSALTHRERITFNRRFTTHRHPLWAKKRPPGSGARGPCDPATNNEDRTLDYLLSLVTDGPGRRASRTRPC